MRAAIWKAKFDGHLTEPLDQGLPVRLVQVAWPLTCHIEQPSSALIGELAAIRDESLSQ
jgi:hypothetical protein